jgi:TolB protein
MGGGRYIGGRPQMSSSGQLVYSSPRSGHGDIYSCLSDGSNTRGLTNNPNYEGDPAWSPDGRHITFVREKDGVAHVWVMNVDGSGQIQLTGDRGYDSSPSFSPDGSRIVFTRNVAEAKYLPGTAASAEIFIVNIDGTGEVRLTRNEEADWGATFSPDGKKIIFSVRSNEIWMMDSDGGQRQYLIKGSSPCFSPDGKQIAFVGDPNDQYQYDIFLLDLDTRHTRKITNTGGYKSSPSVSADGKRVIFLAEPTARGTGVIKIVDLSDMNAIDAGTTD